MRSEFDVIKFAANYSRNLKCVQLLRTFAADICRKPLSTSRISLCIRFRVKCEQGRLTADFLLTDDERARARAALNFLVNLEIRLCLYFSAIVSTKICLPVSSAMKLGPGPKFMALLTALQGSVNA